ncbi:hypothetical protein Pmani_033955 [Petrolisthes manimaculis]|uniref:Uncharacterized protein n=1 Tax=Petrolisthes manimaculis TaxID=1843537 RepID=A0AAE1NNG1_9EUCA|nr:hypothetical protein Pmani_033955 [Petrolisthes manimaculis]
MKPRTSNRLPPRRPLHRLPESDYGTVPWARRSRAGVKMATSGTVAGMIYQPSSPASFLIQHQQQQQQQHQQQHLHQHQQSPLCQPHVLINLHLHLLYR